MKPENLQTLSQISIFVGVILTAIGGLGSYHYGKKADENSNTKSNKKLEEISDKILKNTVTAEKEPTLSINSNTGIKIEKTDARSYFWICIESLNAGSTNYDTESYILAEYKDGDFKLFSIDLLPDNTKILSNMCRALIPFDDQIKRLYLYVKGTYSNLSESKKYRIDDLYYYDPEKKQTNGLIGTMREKILEKLNK